MTRDSLNVAVCSLTASSDKSANILQAIKLVTKAARLGAHWVFLPEMFAYHGPYDKLFEMAESEHGPLNEQLATLAQSLKITLFAGSMAERPEGTTSGKVFNTQYVFGPSGNRLAKYRKIHLFNLLAAEGKPAYCESDGYLAGSDLVTFDHEGWRVGLATCYDLRFPEMFASLTKKSPLDILVTPSAFTLQTGTYHWELLCRARAVENLCYVAASNQVGDHSPGKSSFGHAMIVDPWGTCLATTGKEPGIAIAEISKAEIKRWRSFLPALTNRRPDIYL